MNLGHFVYYFYPNCIRPTLLTTNAIVLNFARELFQCLCLDGFQPHISYFQQPYLSSIPDMVLRLNVKTLWNSTLINIFFVDFRSSLKAFHSTLLLQDFTLCSYASCIFHLIVSWINCNGNDFGNTLHLLSLMHQCLSI